MTFIKSFFVFAVIYLILLRFKKLVPEIRHLMWLFGICSFILIPVFSILFPDFNIGMLKLPKEAEVINRIISPQLMPEAGLAGSEGFPGVAGPAVSQDTLYTSLLKSHWPIWVLLIWSCGVIASLFRVIIGKVGLFLLKKRACIYKDKICTRVLEELSKRMGVRQKIVLLKSNGCGIPFTYDVFRPVILLPSDIENWTDERIRVVLIHEIAHIKREDYLIQFICRLICGVFWYMPLIWIAYTNLQMEQENACDSYVIDDGIKPEMYAGHLVEMVRYTRGRILHAGMYNTLVRGGRLEKRVVNVLNFKRDSSFSRVKSSIKILIISLSCLVLLMIINPVTAKNDAVGIKNAPIKDFYGTWVNDDYDNKRGIITISKIVIRPDGTFEAYADSHGNNLFDYGEYIAIEDTWIDTEGNIWFKAIFRASYVKMLFYELGKIDSSGTIRKSIFSVIDYPSKINPDHGFYKIYYRQ
jgi:beta-lactamase regulating signal transducer with metallopeptidase domain